MSASHLCLLAAVMVFVPALHAARPPAERPAGAYHLETVLRGLSSPVALVTVPDGSGLAAIVEQRGTIRLMKSGQLLANSYLNIQDRVHFKGELGLLCVAFHPGYKTNGRLFVAYSRLRPRLQTVLAEYHHAPGADHATVASERILLTVDKPFENHNGGQLAFGPDGMLYLGTGDGGSGGDPLNHAQNLGSLLGKILRLDVDHQQPFAIPADNPFRAVAGARPEVWAYGLRNPWRFSFDMTGRLWCGDVGQNQWEEIDLIVRGGNYGWKIKEGNHCFPPGANCAGQGLLPPVHEYDRASGVSVTGGAIHSGVGQPELKGRYIYGDFGSGKIWALDYTGGHVVSNTLLADTHAPIAAFGQDPTGALLVVLYDGSIARLVRGRGSP
jgi:glucose/arabinose dehydrogenase